MVHPTTAVGGGGEASSTVAEPTQAMIPFTCVQINQDGFAVPVVDNTSGTDGAAKSDTETS